MDIRISPERLRGVASSLQSQRQVAEDTLTGMVRVVNDLQGEWTGMAQVDYANLFNERVPQMRGQLDEILEQMIRHLRRIADEFEAVDQGVVSSSSGPVTATATVVAGAAAGAAGAAGKGTPPGDEPLVYDGPGTREPSHAAGGCVRHASQRVGVTLRGNAMELPGNYPDRQVDISAADMEGDLRQSGIQPGMLMVWQPGENMYTNKNSQGYSYAVRAAGPGESQFPYGHVAVVEEVGVDYVVISDNHGSAWRIDRQVSYWQDGVEHTENFLDNATYLDMT